MKTRRSIKCEIAPFGKDAVKKRLVRTDPPWPFYLKREIAIHRAFAKIDLPVRVPKMLDAGEDFIVFEKIDDGEPLAEQRHRVPQDRATWEEVIAIARAIRTIDVSIDVQPSPDDRAAMRARLLEDPTSPWIANGLRAHGYDALAKEVKPDVFQHGDLLLRNIVGNAVVDWECAGPHAEGWDAALLSVFAPDWAREALAAPRACFVWALLREIAFRKGKADAIMERLEDDLRSSGA